MITPKQEDAFIDSFKGMDLLDCAITWIQDHLKPTDVFFLSDLEEWASSNGWVKKEDSA